jgi:outer membrane receptor protein involved in Fe transport
MLTGGASAAMIAAAPAHAQQDAEQRYDLPAQPLGDSLRAVALASGVNIIAPSSLIAGITAPALSGRFTPAEAVAILLRGSGLQARQSDAGLTVERDVSAAQAAASDGNDAGIVVTGTRIRGSSVPSPVISMDQEQIRNAGQSTLGEVVRSIPQSFGGGQNPGIGFNVPAINGVDVGGGSSLNLRGLGSDATLTLLNGHRVAYSGSRQSVDVSMIPLGAVDRIEIIADGASAIYGSDAVGGVANILLKRDMDGLEARARFGASTQGGNVRQQYSTTGGERWQSGGFIAAYEFNRNTAVEAKSRSYAATRARGLTLYPEMRNHNVLVSGHQRISSSVSLSADALFNDRRSMFGFAMNPAGDLSVSRAEDISKTRAYAIAPRLSVAAGSGWDASLSGSYAGDRVDFRRDGYTANTRTVIATGSYSNGAHSLELAGDGPLFRLPAGPVKAAVGIGYRNVSLKNDRGAGSPLNFERSQWNRYAYGELNLPLVSPGMALPGLYRLDLSAAARHERYQDTGSVTTPKIGLVYAPIPAVDLKASWGRSFRAPTLLQRYQPPLLQLLNAPVFGAATAPPGSTALYLMGGNRDLAPERATSWSVTGSFHPPAIPGFTAEISYFDIDYVDRIVNPIGFLSQALSDPTYAAQITRSPSPAMLEAILASGASFLNGTGAPYDPANVVAVIDNSNVNAGNQWVHGIDLLAAYHGVLGPSGDEIALSVNASYLKSHRQIGETQPDRPLAGILFNPPNWRGRASATWSREGLSLTALASYTGELSDTRFSPTLEIPHQLRLDFTARYRTDDTGVRWLRGFELTFGIENLFNAAPPPIFTRVVTDTPYDSTNYSPLGRVISVGIAKSW